jgi:hypothetical protein
MVSEAGVKMVRLIEVKRPDRSVCVPAQAKSIELESMWVPQICC